MSLRLISPRGSPEEEKKQILKPGYGSPLEKPEAVDEQTSLIELYSAFAAMVLYLQYFGVILVESVDFGRFGEIFEIFTVLANLIDLNGVSDSLLGVLLVMISISLYPVFIVFTLSDFSRYPSSKTNSKDWFSGRAVYLSFLVFVGIIVFGIYTLLTDQSNISLGLFIGSGYWLVGALVNHTGVAGLFFKSRVQIFFLRGLLVFLVIPYVSLFTNFLVHSSLIDSPEESLFADIGVFFMFAVIFYFFIFELQFRFVLSDKHRLDDNQLTQSWIWCKLTGGNFTNKKQCILLRQMFHGGGSNRDLNFLILFFFERLLMALVGGILGNNDFYDNYQNISGFNITQTTREDIPLISFMSILGTVVVALIIRRPFKSFSLNCLQIFPRFSHLALVTIVYLQDYISDTTSWIILLSLFITTILSFVYFIKPKEHLEEVGKYLTLCGQNVKAVEDIRKLKNFREKSSYGKDELLKNQNVTKSLWKIMSFVDKIRLLHLVEPKEFYVPDNPSNILDLKDFNEDYYYYGMSIFNYKEILEVTENVELFVKAYKTKEMQDFFNSFHSIYELRIVTSELDVNMKNVLFFILHHSRLNKVVLRFQEASGSFVRHLKHFISKNIGTICELTLSRNNLDLQDIGELIIAMGTNNCINLLDLSFNNDKWDNMINLARVYYIIAEHETLEVLRLKNNYMKEHTLSELLDALKKNKSLKEFDITEQKIGADIPPNIAVQMQSILVEEREIQMWVTEDYLDAQASTAPKKKIRKVSAPDFEAY